ncbi:hypothetical protein HGM15179_002155 [Zosterops borbonicus]|uniref:Uncharacterized protein n=1 Tax=Zosterops borbonicus TaxID=364589 RepID=A0A8K1LSR4_9PASS|nr:hypothetical protein HGM15179_002155 [Zosterops borbonicus]
MEPIPAGFRRDPTLARAEPIGNGQHRPGFGGGGYRGCCEKLPEPPPCPMEPIPAGFRRDPTLARAEPIGNGQHRPGHTGFTMVLQVFCYLDPFTKLFAVTSYLKAKAIMHMVVVDVTSMEVFKTRLDGVLNNLV